MVAKLLFVAKYVKGKLFTILAENKNKKHQPNKQQCKRRHRARGETDNIIAKKIFY